MLSNAYGYWLQNYLIHLIPLNKDLFRETKRHIFYYNISLMIPVGYSNIHYSLAFQWFKKKQPLPK